MPPRQKTCLFCGTTLRSKKSKTGGKSDEHIVPGWLMDHLGIRNTIITPMLTESAARRVMHVRQHVVSAFKAGTVCTGCNNGWMSRLSLTEREQFIVARWTLKTAAVLNRSSTYGNAGDGIARRIPDSHLIDVMEGRIPGRRGSRRWQLRLSETI